MELRRLTQRQQEVAVLVSEGHTNQEIADALGISGHTAERHVENILRKLQARSRVQIAMWVAGQDASSLPALPATGHNQVRGD